MNKRTWSECPSRPPNEIFLGSSAYFDFEGSRSGWKDHRAATTLALVDSNDDQDQYGNRDQNQQ